MNNTSNISNTTEELAIVRLYKDIIARGVQPDHAARLVQAHVQMESSPERVTAVRNELGFRLQGVQNKLERVTFQKRKLMEFLGALRGALTGSVNPFRREFGGVDPHTIVQELDKLVANIRCDDGIVVKDGIAMKKSE